MPGQQERVESFEAERINLVSHSSRPYPHYAFKRRMICKNKDVTAGFSVMEKVQSISDVRNLLCIGCQRSETKLKRTHYCYG